MKKQFSRFISLILMTAMFCNAFPIFVSAAEYKVVSENVLYYKDTHEIAEEYYMVSDQPVTTERYTVKGLHVKPTECLVNFVPSGALISDAPSGRGGYYSLTRIVDLDTGESLDANTMMQVLGQKSVYQVEQPVKIVGGYLYQFEYMTSFTASAYVYVASKDQKQQVNSPTEDSSTGGNGICSDWAVNDLNKAVDYGLQPEFLTRIDARKPATRVQFAEIAMKMYEVFTQKSAVLPATNPFTDTTNEFALQAYTLGITSGTTATTYSPNLSLTREQAATMLTRLYNVCVTQNHLSDPDIEEFREWLETTAPDELLLERYDHNTDAHSPIFNDDANISPWAKKAVYLMYDCMVMRGVGEGYAPKSTLSAEQAQIATMRLYEYLKTLPSE